MRRAGRCAGYALACMLAVLLAACGSAPKKPDAAQSKYYLDDGPPESAPDNLAQLPDAVPRDEPFHKFANRPYTVFGQTYVPVVDKEPLKQRGLASWYGKKFHGQKTSSGEVYDMFALTAAHKTLPIPSYARVTNLKNGLSVVVRINDRGPFHPGRVIDLSYAAAVKIGLAAAGSAMVEVERVFQPATTSGEGAVIASASVSTPAAAMQRPVFTQPQSTPLQPTLVPIETSMVAQEAAGLWIQLGAFSSAESAEAFRDHAARELPWMLEPIQVAPRDGLHRVRLGPYRNRDEADAIADKVRQSLGFAPAVTSR